MTGRIGRRFGWVILATLAGCAPLPPAGGDAVTAPSLPARWHAPLPPPADAPRVPPDGAWWAGFDDPLVPRLIAAAEAVSPTVATAAARIEQARATRTAAVAARLPSLDAEASASRGRQDISLPVATSLVVAARAGWELDVFGRTRAGQDAADARLAGARVRAADARVALAAETADSYLGLRACEARVVQARLEAGSRAESSRLTGLSSRAGFESPANAALARASAAQVLVGAKLQAEQCELGVKALVALTGLAEDTLRELLAPASARLPVPATLVVPSVPAAALAQRPDVRARERDLAAASADVERVRAERFPRVSLAGSIGAGRVDFGTGPVSGAVWSLGPLAVTLPIFDAGTRRGYVVAARAAYDAAASAYAATLRTAVREVESALVTLQGSADRIADAEAAARDFEVALRAADARYRSGFGTLFELEEGRRSAFAAQNTLIDLKRERIAAWISLHRALGGGWQGAADDAPGANAAALQLR